MEHSIDGKTIKLIQGDLTEMSTDAIVNAANSRLSHGGGVAGAISRKGGPVVQRESDEWVARYGDVKTGSAAITGSGDLPCRYVIHAVGPTMGSGDEDNKLMRATRSALQLAEEYQLKSIAFPAISTGIFGYPMKDCARVMLKTVVEFDTSSLREIMFCLWDGEALQIFENELKKYKKM